MPADAPDPAPGDPAVATSAQATGVPGDAQPPSYRVSAVTGGGPDGGDPASAAPAAQGFVPSPAQVASLVWMQEMLRQILATNQQAIAQGSTTSEETGRLNTELRDVVRDVGSCLRDLTQLVDHNHDHLVDVEASATSLGVKQDALSEKIGREGDVTRSELSAYRAHFSEYVGSLGVRLDRMEGGINDLRALLASHHDEFLRFTEAMNSFVVADKPAWESVLQVNDEIARIRFDVGSLSALVGAYFNALAPRRVTPIDPSLVEPHATPVAAPLTPSSPSYPATSPTTSHSSHSSGGRRDGSPYYYRSPKGRTTTGGASPGLGRSYSFGDAVFVTPSGEDALGYGPAAQN